MAKAKQTKEQIYDEQIAPLMTRIIAICKEHKIANVCSFSLEPEGALCCTTVMTEDDFDPPERYIECVRLLYPQPPSMLALTTRDKDGNIKEIESIVSAR